VVFGNTQTETAFSSLELGHHSLFPRTRISTERGCIARTQTRAVERRGRGIPRVHPQPLAWTNRVQTHHVRRFVSARGRVGWFLECLRECMCGDKSGIDPKSNPGPSLDTHTYIPDVLAWRVTPSRCAFSLARANYTPVKLVPADAASSAPPSSLTTAPPVGPPARTATPPLPAGETEAAAAVAAGGLPSSGLVPSSPRCFGSRLRWGGERQTTRRSIEKEPCSTRTASPHSPAHARGTQMLVGGSTPREGQGRGEGGPSSSANQ